MCRCSPAATSRRSGCATTASTSVPERRSRCTPRARCSTGRRRRVETARRSPARSSFRRRRAQAQQFYVLDTLAVADLDADSVTAQAIQLVTGSAPPSILFVHYSDVDLMGHDAGWLSSAPGGETLNPEWLRAVAHVDVAIAKLIAVLQTSIEVGSTAVIITADHGGGKGDGCVAGDPPVRQHCTSNAGDVLIPFVLVGKGISAKRLPSGLRITQVAATIAKLLGVNPPAAADAAVSY
ncbi:MAG: alkaline phosphatase family protein [Gemmatimonadaceae bacterium]